MKNQLVPKNLGLSTQILNNLDSYDDFINFYIQINEAANGFSWMKADTLRVMEDRLGDKSLKEMSKELGERYSTLVSYIRVSRAFPPDKRELGASFSLHFQASFADSYNNETKKFDGDTRFELRNKAIDENMSTRTLAKHIQEEKAKRDDLISEDPQVLYLKKIAEEIRKSVSILTKLSLQGNVHSQQILEKIQGIINEYNSI